MTPPKPLFTRHKQQRIQRAARALGLTPHELSWRIIEEGLAHYEGLARQVSAYEQAREDAPPHLHDLYA